jgi:O-antigen biosynthesis protein
MSKTENHLPVPAPEVAPELPPAPAPAYGAAYFASHCGIAYERNEHWLTFFGDIADHVTRDIAPESTLDVGCAMGFLVEALADRGVDAYGVDISDFAIGQVRPDMRQRCRVGTALEAFGRRFDLITCIEVIEHLSAADAETVVQNLCDHTDDVIFSSTPTDHREETHFNVNPPEHWAELFARFGFQRDLTYDLGYLAPWAMRFRRSRDPLPRLVREYERELWHLRNEAQQRNEVLMAQMAELASLRTANAASEIARLKAEVDKLSMELSAEQPRLFEMSKVMLEQAEELRHWRDSVAGRIAHALQRGLTRTAPPGTRRRRSLHRVARAGVVLGTEGPGGLRRAMRTRRGSVEQLEREQQEQYDEWRRRHEPTVSELDRMRRDNREWTARPLVSIIMPTYNSEAAWIHPAIDSVLGQVYENWELCIADDASTAPHVRAILDRYAAADPRIKVVVRQHNGGIAAASASALELATGEFVALLDHDDLLRPHALHRVVERLRSAPDTDIVYSDEDILLRDGRYGKPFFKPDWSPDMLLSVNYVCHFLVIRRQLVDSAGGFRPGFDGAQDHDLLLRTTEQARGIGHIPDVLYSWRQVPGSVALSGEAKMYAYDSGKRAVEEALLRRGLSATVSLGKQLGNYHVRLAVIGQPQVAIVIPTRDRVELLRECIGSVENLSTYRNWSITIIDNDSVDPATLAYFEQSPHRVVRKPGYFNYSRLINFGRSLIDAPYLLTLNNDVTVISPDWIEALLEQAQRPEVGVVGARLLYPNGRPQHEGIAVGNVRGGHMAANLDAGWMGRIIRDVSAVSGACQMVKTAVFDAVGGYDEALPVAYNDVDFCLRVRDAGHLIVYTPHAELGHRESASRGTLDPAEDHEYFWARWGVVGGIRDPYFSPHVRGLNPLDVRLDPLPGER